MRDRSRSMHTSRTRAVCVAMVAVVTAGVAVGLAVHFAREAPGVERTSSADGAWRRLLTRADAADDAIASLQDKFDRLLASQASIDVQLERLAGTLDVAAPAAVEAEVPATAESVDRPAERSDDVAAAQRDLLETTLAFEAVDPQWAEGAEAELADVAQEIVSEDFEVLEIHCASTLCRVEVRSREAEVRWESFRVFLLESPWPAAAYFELDETTGEATAYMAREGSELPMAGANG